MGTAIHVAAAAFALVVFAASVLPAGARNLHNCSDFASQEDAQNVYAQSGGPSDDPNRLDDDKDGVACEALPSHGWAHGCWAGAQARP